MTARREYRTGSLHQRADGMWIGTIEAGWTAKGTRRRVTVSSKDKAEAKRKLRDKRAQIEAEGDTTLAARDTVKMWAQTWLAIQERRLTPKAFATTRSAVSLWIIPTIGHKRFDLLTPADVRAVATAQARATPPRSTSTQRRTHSVLVSLLRGAQAEGYPIAPRLLNTEAPVSAVNDRQDMSVPDATAVLGQAAGLPHGSRWVAALLQGIRQGEALGMTWDAVDLDRERLEVSWQLQPLPYKVRYDRSSGFRVPDGYESRRLAGAMHLVRPKSAAGWRVIPLVNWMHTALTAWRDIAPVSPHGLVWPNLDGSPTYYKVDDEEWYALQCTAEVGHPAGRYYGVHEARHTTATLLMEANVDPAVIIAIMGHSAILTTRGYQHVRTGPAMQALDKVAERLQLR